MQINRLFEIVYMLLDKKTVTAAALAEHFEVSVRTIYRDIDTLSQSGIPVYMTKGKGGGISLLEGYVLNKAVLTDEEKDDILTSIGALTSADINCTDTALSKLSQMLGKSNINWVEIDFSTWSGRQSQIELFNTVKSCILNRKVIEITYSTAKGKTERMVEPLKLCFKSSAWYLYGYCLLRNDYRFFKLNRISNISVRPETVTKIAPQKVFEDHVELQLPYVRLKMKLSADMAYRVYDEFDNYKKLAEGSFLVEVDCPDDQWLFYYIFTFGSSCEVIEPIHIREKITKELKKALKKYVI